MTSVLISSTNFNGQIGNITFYPEVGGVVNIGLQTIPYTYTANDIYGTYSIYFSGYPETCTVTILNPFTPLDCDLTINSTTPSSTPAPTSTPASTPVQTSTPTPSTTSVPPTSTPASTPVQTSTPTPTITNTSSCTLYEGCINETFICGCGTNVNVYWKDDISAGVFGRFYKTLSNCENGINDWNSFSPYYFYNGMKYQVGTNGEIITLEGCS